MADIEHSDMGGNANQHPLHRWLHASEAARFAESVVSGDRGKVSWQTSDNTFWMLRDHAQVANVLGWKELGVAEVVHVDNKYTTTAAASILQRYMVNSNGSMNGVFAQAMVPVAVAGTHLFLVTWVVAGNQMPTDSCAIELFKVTAGVSTATGVADTIPSVAAASGVKTGQFSGNVAVALGDGVAVGIKQAAAEVNAAWNLCVSVKAVRL